MSPLAARSVGHSVPLGVEGVEGTSLVGDAWRSYVRQGGQQQHQHQFQWEQRQHQERQRR